jgi:hypothetical protein
VPRWTRSVVIALALVGLTTAITAPAAATSASAVVAAINAERSARGLPPLTAYADASMALRATDDLIASGGYHGLWSTSVAWYRERGVRPRSENQGRGTAAAGSAASIAAAWSASPGHARNQFDPEVTHVAAAARTVGSTTYYTVHFVIAGATAAGSSPRPDPEPAPAPQAAPAPAAASRPAPDVAPTATSDEPVTVPPPAAPRAEEAVAPAPDTTLAEEPVLATADPVATPDPEPLEVAELVLPDRVAPPATPAPAPAPATQRPGATPGSDEPGHDRSDGIPQAAPSRSDSALAALEPGRSSEDGGSRPLVGPLALLTALAVAAPAVRRRATAVVDRG